MDLNGKKVLVVTSTDNMIWQFLIPHIQDMQKLGATVECACNETGFFFQSLEKETGLSMHKIDIPRKPLSLKIFKAKKELVKLIKKNKYDLIHCHQPVGGVLARLAGDECGVPVLYVAHGFHFYKGAPFQNNVYKIIEKYLSKRTHSLVTMNDEDYLAAQKMKATKVYKINGIGVDLEKYKTDKYLDEHKFRESLGLNDDDFVLLSVAEFIKRKNIISIINSIEKIRNSKIKLLLCGQGELENSLKAIVKTRRLEENIFFLGYRKDISQIIQISNALILVSFHEGLPKCFLEAMAMGKPLISSDIRGSRDLILENEGGLLVPPKDCDAIKDAIEKLYANPQLCKTFGSRNEKFIKNFSTERVLEQMREIYKNI